MNGTHSGELTGEDFAALFTSLEQTDLKPDAITLLRDRIKDHINDGATMTKPRHLAVFLPTLLLHLPLTYNDARVHQIKLRTIEDFTKFLNSAYDGCTDFADLELGINDLSFKYGFKPEDLSQISITAAGLGRAKTAALHLAAESIRQIACAEAEKIYQAEFVKIR